MQRSFEIVYFCFIFEDFYWKLGIVKIYVIYGDYGEKVPPIYISFSSSDKISYSFDCSHLC